MSGCVSIFTLVAGGVGLIDAGSEFNSESTE